MKKLNKKGFTIVELVIVIAVIAILAAVLIPTYTSVVDKANKSRILQEARSTYTEYIAWLDYANGAEVEDNYVVTVKIDSKSYYVAVVKGQVADDYSDKNAVSALALAKVTASGTEYTVLEAADDETTPFTTSTATISST